jgi:hypothetical protein
MNVAGCIADRGDSGQWRAGSSKMEAAAGLTKASRRTVNGELW